MSEDSEDELRIEKVRSEKEQSFEKVPKETVFIFKFKNAQGKSYCLLEYELRQGVPLPYSAVIKGKKVKFNKCLKPEVEEMEFVDLKNNCFTFMDSDISTSGGSTPVQDNTSGLDVEMLKKVLTSEKIKKKSIGFPCMFCSQQFIILATAVKHVQSLHAEEWTPETADQMSSTVVEASLATKRQEAALDAALDAAVDNSEAAADKSPRFDAEYQSRTTEAVTEEDMEIAHQQLTSLEKETPAKFNSNPNWFLDMKASFQDAVIDKCTKRTRDAIDQNEDIKNAAERRLVMQEILNQTVNYLEEVFVDTPKKKHTTQVADLLGALYPSLFKYDGTQDGSSVPSYVGYGLGGVKGLKALPERICNLFRDRHRKRNKKKAESGEISGNEEAPPVKKSKLQYGVINKKFYVNVNDKGSVEKLKMAGKETSFGAREKIFEENRSALQKLIRDSSRSIPKVCDGFHDDPKHYEKHFEYLTETNIARNVEKNLEGQLENMVEFLVSVNTSVEFSEKLNKIQEDCDLEFAGAKTHKYIHLLRMFGDFFDVAGSSFMRIDADGSSKSSSPNIKAVKFGKSYVFELWVEKERILEKMDFAESISAFLHLCFCHGLKYPKEAETVCDFLQRVVAEYGNDEGTKTPKAASSALTKLTKYHIQIGKVLGAKKTKD